MLDDVVLDRLPVKINGRPYHVIYPCKEPRNKTGWKHLGTLAQCEVWKTAWGDFHVQFGHNRWAVLLKQVTRR